MTDQLVPLSPLKSGISLEFMTKRAPALARDIVLKLDGASNLSAAYGLNPDQWESLKASAAFRKMVENAQNDLSGSKGLDEMIKLQSQMSLANGGVLDIAVMANDPKVPYSTRKGCYELLGDFAGVGAKAKQALTSTYAGPLITIILPDRAPMLVGNSRPVIEVEPSE